MNGTEQAVLGSLEMAQHSQPIVNAHKTFRTSHSLNKVIYTTLGSTHPAQGWQDKSTGHRNQKADIFFSTTSILSTLSQYRVEGLCSLLESSQAHREDIALVLTEGTAGKAASKRLIVHTKTEKLEMV